MQKLAVIAICVLTLPACSSTAGNSQPPRPPAPPPATPLAPPHPDQKLEERLTDLAKIAPNPCRARTPGFEALGGWLKTDQRDLGKSQVWIADWGPLDSPLPESHGRLVWRTLKDCAVRAPVLDQYRDRRFDPDVLDGIRADGKDAINSVSAAPAWRDIPFPRPGWYEPELDGTRDGLRVLEIAGLGNDYEKRTPWLQHGKAQALLRDSDTALWILVGGFQGSGENRALGRSRTADGGTVGSSICGDAAALCLFAPWQSAVPGFVGTSLSAPQAAAALDAVWAVWPQMDVLDLRNLAFDCSENMDAPAGESGVVRTFRYRNGREFTSETNSRWGHGVLSLTCLFTPNGGLRNPITGREISGGIYGPLAGPVIGASIMGSDYTGRDFGYRFARSAPRENWALLATASLPRSAWIHGYSGGAFHLGAARAALWHFGRARVELTAARDAIGVVTQWQSGGLILRNGVVVQPEGVGSLIGLRAFRAPMSVSGGLTMAYRLALPVGLTVQVQADHWRTFTTRSRSLWEGADLRESRFTAALAWRFGRHEICLQGVWRSGLVGTVDVFGRSWNLAGRIERAVWLMWRHRR